MGKATVRVSLKTIAFLFPEGSLERVYLHGTWQRERGRNPSMRYGNHQSTRTAYEEVKILLKPYFDEIRRQEYSRHDSFWTDEMVTAVQQRVPVRDLPLVEAYR